MNHARLAVSTAIQQMARAEDLMQLAQINLMAHNDFKERGTQLCQRIHEARAFRCTVEMQVLASFDDECEGRHCPLDGE